MRGFVFHLSVVLAVVTCPIAARGQLRTWTDSSGKFSVEAELVDCDGKIVKLKTVSDGKVIEVPLKKLSEKDQSRAKDGAEGARLRGEVKALKEEVQALRGEIKALKQSLTEANAELASLKAENAKLAARVPQEPSPTSSQNAVAESRQTDDTKSSALHIRPSIESPVILKVGDGELRVRFQFTTLYIPANIPKGDDILVRGSRTEQCGYTRFFFVGYRPGLGGQHKKPTTGFFRVNGKAAKLECRSSNEAVLRVVGYDDEEGLCVEGLAPGKANIVVSLAGRSVEVPLKVVQIPVRTGDFRVEEHTGGRSHTREDVIKILGLPDDQKETFVRWPDFAFHAGHFFSPRAGTSWTIRHWKYDKYPGAEIIFVGDSSAYYARSGQTLETAEQP